MKNFTKNMCHFDFDGTEAPGRDKIILMVNT